MISEVVSLSDTPLAFQWGLECRRQHGNDAGTTPADLQESGRLAAASQRGRSGDANQYDPFRMEKSAFLNISMKAQ